MRFLLKLLALALGVAGGLILNHGLPVYPHDSGAWWMATILSFIGVGIGLIATWSLTESVVQYLRSSRQSHQRQKGS